MIENHAEWILSNDKKHCHMNIALPGISDNEIEISFNDFTNIVAVSVKKKGLNIERVCPQNMNKDSIEAILDKGILSIKADII